jgi:hypothetical protein
MSPNKHSLSSLCCLDQARAGQAAVAVKLGALLLELHDGADDENRRGDNADPKTP